MQGVLKLKKNNSGAKRLIIQEAVIREPRFRRPTFIYMFFLVLWFCAPSVSLIAPFVFTLHNEHVRHIPDRDLCPLAVLSGCMWQFRYFLFSVCIRKTN